MSKKPDEHLNAAQMAQINKAIEQFHASMQLRQWCIERALTVSSPDPVQMAKNIHDFIVPPPPPEQPAPPQNPPG